MNDKVHHQPLGGNQMPRFGGPATMLRLPAVSSAKGLDACFVGVPFDIGTSNRAGARFGPRQIRAESCLIRPYNMATRAAPERSRLHTTILLPRCRRCLRIRARSPPDPSPCRRRNRWR